ncbi:MAG TPA: DHA2 family efflux MFS transporter permease subunit [Pseudonocardia sp.]|uniref:DHA2 family efflux MFS transporter permease subunit n=1 Tax=Pseudonocardia sp. TaxID=60912 RepID=UPI002F415158
MNDELCAQREIDTPPAERAKIPREIWAAASVMALGGFLGNMDGPIVAVGLRTMELDLGVSLAAIQWVATAFLLGLAAALPLTPWLARRLGAGRLWLWALAAFMATSVLCALSPSAATLIGARAVQGMTAGVLVAAGQTVIGLAVGPTRLGRVMGTLGLVVGLAPIVGPSVGGVLLARFSWPALFWVNLPIGALALLLGLRFVPRGERLRPPPMDWLGLALVSVGLPLLVYALAALGGADSRATLPYLMLTAVGLGGLVLFVLRSLRAPNPVIQVRLAGQPLMAASLVSVLLAGAGMLAAVLLLPLWFQIEFGRGPAATGVLLAPLAIGTLLIMLVAGRLTDRYGGGSVAFAGSLVVLLSTAPLPWLGPHTPMAVIQALLFLRGTGLGLTMMPAMTTAYASVRAIDLGDATALANVVMRVGGAVGGALSVIVLTLGIAAGGPALGFRAAFLALTCGCVLNTLAAAWLRNTERHTERCLAAPHGPNPPHTASRRRT